MALFEDGFGSGTGLARAHTDFLDRIEEVIAEAGLGPDPVFGDATFRPDGVTDLIRFKDDNAPNLEPVPITVRYQAKVEIPPMGGYGEAAAFYCKLDPAGSNQHRMFLYGEITDNQEDTEGALVKVIHQGHGDAFFVALYGSGAVGYEAASFSDGTRGIISTMQKPGLPNSTLFTATWEQDTVPNFGLFYAEQCPGNAFLVRKWTSAPDGVTQFRILENDLSRYRFAVHNSGELHLASLAATAGAQLRESPELRLRGAYWTGSANKDSDVVIKNVLTAAGQNEARFYLGDWDSPSLAAVLKDSGDFEFQGRPRWLNVSQEQSTVGSAGAASALPANPTKYLKIVDSAGTELVIPAYAAV